MKPCFGMFLILMYLQLLQEAEYKEEEEFEAGSGQESGEESDDETERKGTQSLIETNNPNMVKPKNVKARDVNTGKTTELSRREREELEKQRAYERYMRLQEKGKTGKIWVS
ncbi:hypothetical protein REPUB_Repub14bG0119700 [Reevesia pubescens]